MSAEAVDATPEHATPLRTVVVGASSGLGRSLAVGLAGRGARVALLARRLDRITDAAAEAGSDAVAVVCDVADEDSVHSAVDQAATELGGIDALVYAAGVGPLSRLADVGRDDWRQLFDTNVIGAATVTAAALPHLVASSGAAAYLSSVSASMTPPWPGLGAYAVTKAALDKLIEAWRAEQPRVGFTRVVVGECGGGEGASTSEFATGWDGELAVEMAPVWVARQYLSGALLDIDELIGVVDTVLRVGATASIPSVTVVPRPPA